MVVAEHFVVHTFEGITLKIYAVPPFIANSYFQDIYNIYIFKKP